MPFAPEYITHVLNENFEDAKTFFLAPQMAVHYAHLVMLVERDIVSPADGHELRLALDAISETEVRATAYDGSTEDLFCHIERLVTRACGETVGGRLHTARSRNDIDATMYRMRHRESLLAVLASTIELRRVLSRVAAPLRETVVAAHTHTQPAQPTTVAHYLLAVVEQLERDGERLRAAYRSTNRCPLGACAITGTGFPIDRRLTSDLLGFDAPMGNTYGSIATVDYLLESATAVAVLVVGLGRVVQDLLLWCTAEFDYIRLGDGFVQRSSIMPQKRNPVALEHARAIGSKALGQASALLLGAHNTPFGDIVDTQDDLQPLVVSMFRDVVRAVTLVAAAIDGAEFNRQAMEARAGAGWITITELADVLTRDHGLAFKTSHEIGATLIAERSRDPAMSLSEALARASTKVTGQPLRYESAALERLLSPAHFVAVRATPGGPAPDETRRALVEARARLEADDAWLLGARDRLVAAERQLGNRRARL